MALSAKELRIGNYINAPHGDVQIEYFTEIGAHFIDGNGGTFASLRPIPLTEEWLLWFSFKYQDRDVNSTNGKERFYISPPFGKHKEYYLEMQLPSSTPFNSPFVWLGWDIGGGREWIHLPEGHKLRHVHQLQNLYFALAGEELTIKNDKL